MENEAVGEACYYVTAYDLSCNESDKSNELVFDSIPPAQVDDIVTSASVFGINLIWNEAEDNVKAIGYYIYRDGIKIADVSEPSYNDTNIISGNEYSYYIEAYDEWKNVSEKSESVVVSSVLDTEPPLMPTGLKISSKTATSVVITWDAAVDNMSIAGYEVFRDGESIGITGLTEYKDSGVVLGTSYEYSVLAIDTAGNKSPKSVSIFAVPNGIYIQKTTPVTGTAFGGSAKQTFRVYFANDNNSVGATAVMSYSLDGINWTEVSMKGPYASGSSFYFDSSINAADITLSGKYFIKYTVYDADGNASTCESDFYVDKTAPQMPENLSAVSEAGSVKITWDIAKEADVVSYRLYRSESENGTYKQIYSVNDRNKNIYIDSSVFVNVTYYYKLAAVDKFGQVSEYSITVTCLVEDDNESPVITSIMPINNTVLSDKSTISVKAEDNINVVSLKLQYNIQGSNEWIDAGTEVRNTSSAVFRVSDIPVDGEVNIRAVASDAMGNISDNYYVRTYTIDRTGPEKIKGITTVAYTNKLLVNWQDVADNDFSYFRVEYKEKDEAEYKKYINVSKKRGTYIEGLKADTDYNIRIAAYDIYGNRGIDSDIVTVSTITDNKAPVIKSISPYPGRYSAAISLYIKATDETGIAKTVVQYRKNDTDDWQDVCVMEYSAPKQSVSVSYKWDTSGLTEGIYTVRAVCEDMYGNISDAENTINVEYYIDHTSPSKPIGLVADGNEGYINISWDKGIEDDLKYYNIYRSENGIEYKLIKEKLTATYYNDRDTILGNDYSYYVTAVDTTGHESSSSEAVSCKIDNDTTAPQIVSVSPRNTTVLSAKPNIGVSAKDNYMLSTIRLEYLNSNNKWEVIEEKSVDVYAVNVVFKWDASDFADGSCSFRAIAADAMGNESEPYYIDYSFNTGAPDMSAVTAEGKEGCAELSWEASTASDLAAYYIYRSDDQGTKYRKIGETGNTAYTDKNVLPGKTYYYKAEAVDRYNNRTESNSCIVKLPDTDTIAPVAKAGGNRTAVLNTAIGFDGTGSADNVGVKEYLWDFGDGVTSDLAQPSHIYTEAGEFTVTLTVKDAKGNSSSTQIRVTVNDLSKAGTAVITLRDSNTANPVANASVYVRCPDGSTIKAKTDSSGNYELTGTAGNYEVCFYKEDYLPTSLKTSLKAGDSLMLTQTIEYGKVVVGTLSVKRMTLDEIEAVGIDITAPENQVVYKYQVKVSYISEDGENSDTVAVFANPDGKVYNPHIPVHKGGSTSTESSSDTDVYANALPNKQGKAPTIVYWVIPGSTSWLSEFFEVKLVVDNKADEEFTLENSCVTLNLPEGLEFVPSDKSQSLSLNLGTIAGSSSKTVSWVIKGSAKGSYDLTADYSGILMPFEEEVKTTFKTQDSFRVYGSDALHMYIEYPDYIKEGENYTCRIGIKNVADFTIYNLNINLTNGETVSIKELKAGAVLWSEQEFAAEKTGNFANLEVITVESEENAIEYTGIPVKVPLDVYVSDSCLAPEIRGDRAFAIHTSVYNQKDYDVKNVKASITFENPECIEMLDDFYTTELTKTVDELIAGESCTFDWEIRVKDGFDISNVKYTVTVTADEQKPFEDSFTIDADSINRITIVETMGEYLTEDSRKVSVTIG